MAAQIPSPPPFPDSPQPRSASRLFAAAPAVLAAAIGIYLAAGAAAMALDGTMFLRYARQLAGEWGGAGPPTALQVLREQHQHPGYPLLVCAVHAAAGPWLPADPAAGWERAGQIVSLIAGTGLVFALGVLAGMLCGRRAGFAAGLLAAVGSGFAHTRADVLSDPAALALMTWSAIHAVRCLQRPRAGEAALCGVLGGLAYLVRPEAIQFAAIAGVILAWRAAFGASAGRRAAMVSAVALAVPALMLSVPYMVVKGSPLTKKAHLAAPAPASAPAAAFIRPAALRSADPGPVAPDQDEPAGGAASPLAGYPRFAKLVARPLGLVFVPFALLGLWRCRRRLRRRAEMRLLFAVVAINVLVLPPALYGTLGYVDSRHVLPAAVAALPFVWPGLTTAAGLVTRKTGAVALAVLLTGAAGMAAATVRRPLHDDHLGLRRAGEWLRGRVGPGRGFIDPAMLSGHYADLDRANLWDRYPAWTAQHFDRLVAARPAADWLVIADGMPALFGGPDRLPEVLGGRRLVEAAAFPQREGSPRMVRVYRLAPALR